MGSSRMAYDMARRSFPAASVPVCERRLRLFFIDFQPIPISLLLPLSDWIYFARFDVPSLIESQLTSSNIAYYLELNQLANNGDNSVHLFASNNAKACDPFRLISYLLLSLSIFPSLHLSLSLSFHCALFVPIKAHSADPGHIRSLDAGLYCSFWTHHCQSYTRHAAAWYQHVY